MQHDAHVFDRWCDQAFSNRKVKVNRYPTGAERAAAVAKRRALCMSQDDARESVENMGLVAPYGPLDTRVGGVMRVWRPPLYLRLLRALGIK